MQTQVSGDFHCGQIEERLALTADELAQKLGISRKTVFNHTAPRGSLKPTRIGSAVRYTRNEVERWLAERQQGEANQ